ncbi:MAG TPA: CBS domain-containing protein [Methylomirabilota bacterium]|jgi:CBS domain-containing protein
MKVASILRAKGLHVETVAPETTLGSVAWTLRSRAIGALVVVDGHGSIAGVISERDIVNGLAEHGADLLGMRVAQVMNRSVVACTPEDNITSVMAQMTRYRVRHVVVTEQGRLHGIVSIGDVVKHRLDELELEANVLRETLIARR